MYLTHNPKVVVRRPSLSHRRDELWFVEILIGIRGCIRDDECNLGIRIGSDDSIEIAPVLLDQAAARSEN
jgi:hypothetical protein